MDYLTKNNNAGYNWYIFYTCPRAEKIAREELIRSGYEIFLPTINVSAVWKNRQKKIIEKVLFPSYIFVNSQKKEIPKILKIPKIVTYLRSEGQPSVIKNNEIEKIKKMIELNKNIDVESIFNINDRVKIISGPLRGFEGILVQQKGKIKFGIQIAEINQAIFVEVAANIIEKI